MQEQFKFYISNYLISLRKAFVFVYCESNENFHFLKRRIFFELHDGNFDYKGNDYTIPNLEDVSVDSEAIIKDFGFNPAEIEIWDKAYSMLKDEEKNRRHINVSLSESNENSFLLQLNERNPETLDWLMKNIDFHPTFIRKIRYIKSLKIKNDPI